MKEVVKSRSVLNVIVLSLMVLVLTSGVLAFEEVESDEIPGFYLAARSDFGSGLVKKVWPPLIAPEYYRYSGHDIVPDKIDFEDSARSILYDLKVIRLQFDRLNPQAKYKLRILYLSNSHDRVVTLMADDETMQKDFALPYAEKVEFVFDVPSGTYQDGKVELKFINKGGVNVVVSSIELWSSDDAEMEYIDFSAEGDLRGSASGTLSYFSLIEGRAATGKPISGAVTELRLGGQQEVLKVKTDIEGKFSVTVPQGWRGEQAEWIEVTAVKDGVSWQTKIPLIEVFIPRLTPKPCWVKGTEKSQIDLDGIWGFKSEAPDNGPETGKSKNVWAQIEVPGEWMMQGFTVEEGKPAAYRRQFAIAPDWEGRRIKLRFDAVFGKTQIWLNGKEVGNHMGTFTSFEVDVTEAALPGRMNRLYMEVTCESLAETLTSGKLMVGYQSGGIIRSVSAFAVPKLNISSFHVGTTFDKNYRNATIEVLLEVTNEGSEDVKKVTVDFTLREATDESKRVKIRAKSFKVAKTVKAGETVSRTIKIAVKSPKQWNAETPNLYFLDCTLNGGGQAVENARQRFGFRQLEIRGNQVFLNGRLIRLRGVSRQDSHPLTGRVVPKGLHRRDMDLMAWANVNNTYTCAFSPDEEVLKLADEMGIYMMEEPCTCWVTGVHTNDPEFYPYLLRPMLEMIQRSRSHPCVLTWMVADESSFGANFQRVLDKVRSLDASRPVHFAWDPGGEIFDFGSMHYPGYKGLAAAAESKRPFIFDQYCSAYMNVPELLTDPGLRDEWAYKFVPYWEAIWKTPSMWGAQVFNFQDDVFFMPSGEILGCGPWGVIDYWRRPKPELWHIKKAYTPVKIKDETEPVAVPEPGEPILIEVENRYDFTNLSEVLIEWSLGDESGRVQADVSPHSIGTISIRPKTKQLEGETLSLKFYRDGMMLDEYKLSIGNSSKAEDVVSESSGPLKLIETDKEIRIEGRDFGLIFDRGSGQIREATVQGDTVLVGGPVLMLLPERPEVFTAGAKPESNEVLFNETCHDWKADKVTASESDDGVEIVVEGQYKEADGKYIINIDRTGGMSIDYDFTTKIDFFARQIGIVLYVPRSCDSLSWKRKGLWSVYPDDHIGRLEGVARAFRDSSLPAPKLREKPPWPWYLDSNALGTRDFRATRRDILRASLTDAAGRGIAVKSDGTQHVRAFVDDERIGILIADYSVGGLGQLPWEMLRLEVSRNSVSKGTSLKGTVRIVKP